MSSNEQVHEIAQSSQSTKRFKVNLVRELFNLGADDVDVSTNPIHKVWRKFIYPQYSTRISSNARYSYVTDSLLENLPIFLPGQWIPLPWILGTLETVEPRTFIYRICRQCKSFVPLNAPSSAPLEGDYRPLGGSYGLNQRRRFASSARVSGWICIGRNT